MRSLVAALAVLVVATSCASEGGRPAHRHDADAVALRQPDPLANAGETVPCIRDRDGEQLLRKRDGTALPVEPRLPVRRRHQLPPNQLAQSPELPGDDIGIHLGYPGR